MKKSITILFLFVLVPLITRAQDTTVVPVEKKEPPAPSKVFYGGTIGVSFGSYFRLSVQPMVGYSFTPKISGGVKVGYEYVSDTRTSQTFTWHNFGASVFTRYRFIPQAYAHAEFAYMSYDSPVDRYGVPFLLLGGGVIQSISPNTSLYAEILFDVLQDDKSPYAAGTPFISIGVAVGF